MLINLVAVLAQAQPQQQAPPGSSLLSLMLMLGAMFVIFWLLIIRPQQKQRARIAAMLNSLKKDDHVMTIGGIYGVITNIRREADEVTLRVDDTNNVKIKVALGAIARVIKEEESEKKQEKK